MFVCGCLYRQPDCVIAWSAKTPTFDVNHRQSQILLLLGDSPCKRALTTCRCGHAHGSAFMHVHACVCSCMCVHSSACACLGVYIPARVYMCAHACAYLGTSGYRQIPTTGCRPAPAHHTIPLFLERESRQAAAACVMAAQLSATMPRQPTA